MNRIHNMRNRMLASAGMFLAVFLFAVTVPHVVPAQTIPETPAGEYFGRNTAFL